jgi:hypothetical protein
MASAQSAKDELTSTVLDAVRSLPTSKQAAILLETSLALIEAGQCGVSRLFFLEVSTHSRVDMERKSRIFLKFISRRQDYRKRT